MNIAIVLAGGKGKRMGSEIPKQFLNIEGKPVIYHALKAFQDSEVIDEIIVVSSKDYYEYFKTNVSSGGIFSDITKIKKIVIGGAERYDSVYSGLSEIDDNGYVFIHDGARPCVTPGIINDCYRSAKDYETGIAAVPVKDTIKCVDENGFCVATPDRKTLWQIQTPQVFKTKIIQDAYRKLYELKCFEGITDDAMILETIGNTKVKMVMSDYRNIKITTPEDMEIASLFLNM